VASAARHRRRGTAAQADQHRRTAEHEDVRARRDIALVDMLAVQQADTTGHHDGLVVTAQFGAIGGIDPLFEGTEIAAGIGAAELIVEGGGADRAVDHDVEGGGNALGLAIVFFPGLLEARDSQVRHRETAQPGLGLGTDAGGALVANFPARAGGGARKRRDRGRMIVRLHLHQDIELRIQVAILGVIARRRQAAAAKALDDRGIIVIGGQDAVAVTGISVLDHLEQGRILFGAVDGPAGVEYLVSAVF
jgi:hypothetical protein